MRLDPRKASDFVVKFRNTYRKAKSSKHKVDDRAIIDLLLRAMGDHYES